MSDYDIECQGITKYYGRTAVLEDLDLDVRRGEFFSLLGPSGSGKTTILRIIAGFEPITKGTLRLRGAVANDIPAHRRGVGLVFQQLALFPHLSVGENIGFGLRVKHLPNQEVAERVGKALELMRLPGFEARRITELSGGQRQRIALARALVTEPTVLLMDEPLTGLDYKLSIEMKNEFKRIHSETGTTFVYVTHDQTSALGISERIAVLDRGKIVQIGPPDEIYGQPRTRFVADFIGNANILRGEFTGDGRFQASGLSIQVADGGDRGEGWVSIKPERIRVGVASPGDNIAEGIVEDVTYQGSHSIIGVRAGDVRLAVVTDTFRGSVGDRIQLSWAPQDVVSLVA